MKYVVRAEWISYDKTNIYDGTIAQEFDPGKEIVDMTADVWLVEADSEEAAIAEIGTPWEVWPTRVFAYVPNPPRWSGQNARHIGTERAPYWRYKRQTKNEYTGSLADMAQQLLIDSGFDINQPVPFAELAPVMVEKTGCHPETAKRHLTKAARVLRGESVAKRGGAREGAGRPPTP